ncbi:MAG: hypothetical protein JSR33_10330, partial [Proteobacteria bacterium]|nr:hypothetical protein [Pseudomonadota bacterium]
EDKYSERSYLLSRLAHPTEPITRFWRNISYTEFFKHFQLDKSKIDYKTLECLKTIENQFRQFKIHEDLLSSFIEHFQPDLNWVLLALLRKEVECSNHYSVEVKLVPDNVDFNEQIREYDHSATRGFLVFETNPFWHPELPVNTTPTVHFLFSNYSITDYSFEDVGKLRLESKTLQGLLGEDECKNIDKYVKDYLTPAIGLLQSNGIEFSLNDLKLILMKLKVNKIINTPLGENERYITKEFYQFVRNYEERLDPTATLPFISMTLGRQIQISSLVIASLAQRYDIFRQLKEVLGINLIEDQQLSQFISKYQITELREQKIIHSANLSYLAAMRQDQVLIEIFEKYQVNFMQTCSEGHEQKASQMLPLVTLNGFHLRLMVSSAQEIKHIVDDYAHFDSSALLIFFIEENQQITTRYIYQVNNKAEIAYEEFKIFFTLEESEKLNLAVPEKLLELAGRYFQNIWINELIVNNILPRLGLEKNNILDFLTHLMNVLGAVYRKGLLPNRFFQTFKVTDQLLKYKLLPETGVIKLLQHEAELLDMGSMWSYYDIDCNLPVSCQLEDKTNMRPAIAGNTTIDREMQQSIFITALFIGNIDFAKALLDKDLIDLDAFHQYLRVNKSVLLDYKIQNPGKARTPRFTRMIGLKPAGCTISCGNSNVFEQLCKLFPISFLSTDIWGALSESRDHQQELSSLEIAAYFGCYTIASKIWQTVEQTETVIEQKNHKLNAYNFAKQGFPSFDNRVEGYYQHVKTLLFFNDAKFPDKHPITELAMRLGFCIDKLEAIFPQDVLELLCGYIF